MLGGCWAGAMLGSAAGWPPARAIAICADRAKARESHVEVRACSVAASRRPRWPPAAAAAGYPRVGDASPTGCRRPPATPASATRRRRVADASPAECTNLYKPRVCTNLYNSRSLCNFVQIAEFVHICPFFPGLTLSTFYPVKTNQQCIFQLFYLRCWSVACTFFPLFKMSKARGGTPLPPSQ